MYHTVNIYTLKSFLKVQLESFFWPRTATLILMTSSMTYYRSKYNFQRCVLQIWNFGIIYFIRYVVCLFSTSLEKSWRNNYFEVLKRKASCNLGKNIVQIQLFVSKSQFRTQFFKWDGKVAITTPKNLLKVYFL